MREYTLLEMKKNMDYIATHLEDRERYQKVWFDALSRSVEITAYNPIRNQTDDNPRETASGRTVSLQSIAVSRDLLQSNGGPFNYGDTVYVVVPFIVDDTMNKRYTNRVDVFMERQWAARIWGEKTGWLAN
ncbi:MAG: hypothetical protein ABIA75_04730 [Candidatus Neomarinimicrobiota bacterium]